MRMQGKNALVTGGASGIGAATARKFALEGAHVVIVDFNAEKGQQVVAEIRQQGGFASFEYADLADETSIQHCATAVAQQIPALHALVNNAGIIRNGLIEDSNP